MAQTEASLADLESALWDFWLFEQEFRRCLRDTSIFEERFPHVLAPDFRKNLARLDSLEFKGEHISKVLAPLFGAMNSDQIPNIGSFQTAILIWDWNHPDSTPPSPPKNPNTGLGKSTNAFQAVSTGLHSQHAQQFLQHQKTYMGRHRHHSEKRSKTRQKQARENEGDKRKRGGRRTEGVDEEEDGSIICDGSTGSEEDVPLLSKKDTGTTAHITASLGSSPEPEYLRENFIPCHQCSYADERCLVVKGRRTKNFKRACGRCSNKKIACSFSLHPDLQQRLKEAPNVPTTGHLPQKDLLQALHHLRDGMSNLRQGQEYILRCQKQTMTFLSGTAILGSCLPGAADANASIPFVRRDPGFGDNGWGEGRRSHVPNITQPRGVGRFSKDTYPPRHLTGPFGTLIQAGQAGQTGEFETNLSSPVDHLKRCPLSTCPPTASAARACNATTVIPDSGRHVTGDLPLTEEPSPSLHNEAAAILTRGCYQERQTARKASPVRDIMTGSLSPPDPSHPSSPLTSVSSMAGTSTSQPWSGTLAEDFQKEPSIGTKRKSSHGEREASIAGVEDAATGGDAQAKKIRKTELTIEELNHGI